MSYFKVKSKDKRLPMLTLIILEYELKKELDKVLSRMDWAVEDVELN